MDTKAELEAKMLDALTSGGDLWVFDQYVGGGPDSLERARKLLIERRAAYSDPDEAASLTRVIRWLEKGDEDASQV